jgi:hypothetical protein
MDVTREPTFRPATLTAALPLLVVLSLILAPRAVQAQMCIGSPNDPGQFSMGFYLDFLEGGTGYGITSVANLENPYAIGASLGAVDLDDWDSNQTVASALGLMEIPFLRFTACPVVEIQWGTLSETLPGGTLEVDSWAFPLGISVGSLFEVSPTMNVLPTGRLGLVHLRSSTEANGLAGETETATELFLDAGATLSVTPFFLRGILRLGTGDLDTSFGVGAGIRF